MTASYAYRASHGWVEIIGAWASMLGDHDDTWLDTATPAERQQAGAFLIGEGQLLPHAHQIKVGEEIADVGGNPIRRGVFVDMTVEDRRGEMTAQLRRVWRTHELGGFTGPAGHVATDADAQRRLHAALAQIRLTDAESCTWEVRCGDFEVVSAGQLGEIAATIFGHVATCAVHARNIQRSLLAAKTHAQLTAVYVDSGWPP